MAAKGSDNLMPFVIDAVEHLCTLGEISDELRKVYGEYA
jgi:methylmalonyl-CoA mutase N-terminal domain/subunit